MSVTYTSCQDRRVRCEACHWIGKESQLLVAPNPWEPVYEIQGCPNCKMCDGFEGLCDAEGCEQISSMGTPHSTGYKMTCHRHVLPNDVTTPTSNEVQP
jgi:hypothetical protein